MAFSEAQKDQIRRFLGYPAAFRDMHYRLESMMDVVGANAVEQASVEAILTELVTIDGALASSGAAAASYGELKKVDEVEFYPASESSRDDSVGTLTRAKMLIERLRQRMSVPLAGDYFGIGTQRNFEIQIG